MAKHDGSQAIRADIARSVRDGDVDGERRARAKLAMGKVQLVLEMAARSGVTFSREQVAQYAALIGDDGKISFDINVGGHVTAVNGRPARGGSGARMAGYARHEF